MKLFFSASLAVLLALTLVIWGMAPPGADPSKTRITWVSDPNPMRRDQYETFEKLNPKAEVLLDPGNNAQEKVIVQSIAGVGPDAFDVYVAAQAEAYIKAGIAMELTSILEENGVNIPSETWPGSQGNTVYEGRVYGVPLNASANAIWFNKDLFDKAGIPYPKGRMTWEELIDLAGRLTIRDPNGKPKQFGFYSGFNSWRDIAAGYGARKFTPDGTRCVIDSEESIASLQFTYDLIFRYRITPTPVEEQTLSAPGGWGSGHITQFMGGRLAMAIGGRWWLNLLRSEKNLRLGVVELPTARVRRFAGAGRGLMINRKSKHLEAALAFALYFCRDDYNKLLNRQADGVSAFKVYADDPEFLFNPAYPDETDNAIWAEAMRLSVPEETSPFITQADFLKIEARQLDFVKAQRRRPADALREIARQTNAKIQQNLREVPGLREKYDAALAASRLEAAFGQRGARS